MVGFNGNGYLELVSHTLKKKASFGFMFATLQQDVLLMLSTTESLIVCTRILYLRVQRAFLNVTIIFLNFVLSPE